MGRNFRQVVKNISYSFGANVVSLGISVLMVMFVPKLLLVEDYGKWQLFLFYISYLGFLHFGWEDGIYLRYAGKRFDELNPRVFSGQFLGIVILQLSIIGLSFLLAQFFITDPIKKMVFLCAISLALFVNFNNGCNFIMQITNRIKDYARMTLLEQASFFVFVFSFLFMGHNQFDYMYVAKLAAVVIISACYLYLCRALWTADIPDWRDILHETGLNIEVGIKLMFANIASMLIIGIVRYGISMGWDVSTFGKVSLTLGVSNFLMVFINSVSVVFFPILKRMEKDRLPEIYRQIRSALAFILFGMLIVYYPLKEILSWWLPQYADSLIYMSVLFPICLFESKISLLINTYLKSLRREALMLKINIISLIVAAIITFISIEVLHDLNVAVFSIVFLYAFRCELAEHYIENILDIDLKKDICIELFVVAVFIVSSVVLDSWLSTLIYAGTYILYMMMNRTKVVELRRLIRGSGD